MKKIKSLLGKSLAGEQKDINSVKPDIRERENFVKVYHNILSLKRGTDLDELHNGLITDFELKILESGCQGLISYLYNNGIKFNTPDLNGLTPLHYIVSKKEKSFISFLFDLGLDFSVKSKDGINCSFFALYKGNLEVFGFMKEKSIEPIAPYKMIFEILKKSVN